jgi:PAS domain-containing protein
MDTYIWDIVKNVGITFTSIAALFTLYFKAIKPSINAYIDRTNKSKERDSKIDTIFKQLNPNGGSTISDKIDLLVKRSYNIESKMEYSHQVQKSMMDTIGLAYWESDTEGNCIIASRGLSILLGVPESEIMGSGWAQLLHDKDKDRIFNSYMFSVKYKTKFEESYSFEVDGQELKVRAIAFPVLNEDKTKLIGMFGTIKLED